MWPIGDSRQVLVSLFYLMWPIGDSCQVLASLFYLMITGRSVTDCGSIVNLLQGRGSTFWNMIRNIFEKNEQDIPQYKLVFAEFKLLVGARKFQNSGYATKYAWLFLSIPNIEVRRIEYLPTHIYHQFFLNISHINFW